MTRRLDLAAVRRILAQADLDATHLDGQPILDDDGRKSTASASRQRELTEIADKLMLAAALVRNESSYARGRIDPLDPPREGDAIRSSPSVA